MKANFRSKFLLNEIELSQPILAISTLIDELKNMELLPQISSSHWTIEEFRQISSKTHLSLAVMIENLFKFTATITSGTEVRLTEALVDATAAVAKLDRAPRSTKESWHVLRNELKQAQRHLKRFENANQNYNKLLIHTYNRISTVLLNVYRYDSLNYHIIILIYNFKKSASFYLESNKFEADINNNTFHLWQ